jgi:hypothetical protein
MIFFLLGKEEKGINSLELRKITKSVESDDMEISGFSDKKYEKIIGLIVSGSAS